MRLAIRALRIEVQTETALYGTEFEFRTNGLNIVRAENSCGKSTIMTAVMYGLGLEALLSASQQVPLPYVVKSYVPEGSKNLPVIESNVFVEIENEMGGIFTVKRQIKGEKDNRLIERFDGPVITNKEKRPIRKQEFYCRHDGGATRELGFHRWLAEFVGADLPLVPRYDGDPVPLYLECIFPLNFIEQKRGWTSIQANMPLHYRIRDARKRALEFVLSLDQAKHEPDAQEIKARLGSLNSEWKREVEHIRTLCQVLGVSVDGLPGEPQAIWPPTPAPVLKIQHEGKWRILDDYRGIIQGDLEQLEKEVLPATSHIADELSSKLKGFEQKLAAVEMFLRQQQLKTETASQHVLSLQDRSSSLKSDIQKHKDARLLKDFGGDVSAMLSTRACPVCAREIDGVIMEEPLHGKTMTVEDNIAFLQDELKAVDVMLGHGRNIAKAEQARTDALREGADRLRAQIRTARTSLVQDGRLPSLSALEDRINLKKRIKQVDELLAAFEVRMETLEHLAEAYRELFGKLKAAPRGMSQDDKDKLNSLKGLMQEQLRAYGFSSFDPSLLDISDQTLHPTVDGLDWYFEASASDNIRAIWAFSLGLLELSASRDLCHLGLVMFDEPKQHSAHGKSMGEFLKRAARASLTNRQVIVATSEPSASLLELTKQLDVKIFDLKLDSKIIHRLDSGIEEGN